MGRPAQDLAGQRFGLLLVLGRDLSGSRAGCHARWLVRCDCGVEKITNSGALTRGSANSCGCKRGDFSGAKKRTHGMSKSRTYSCWASMKARCENPRVRHYRRYGGRGIKVCSRWSLSFEAFLEDMGEMPKGLSLDRINNDGHYEPANCRWATPKEQGRNRSDTPRLTHNGETLSLSEWAERLGLPYYQAHRIVRSGRSLWEARE
jgi:hypothetical protein